MMSQPPETMEEYNERRSSKIDAIVDIILYHQAERGRPPLAFTPLETPDAQGRLNHSSPTQWDEYSADGVVNPDVNPTPDKIVLYIAFPEHNTFLKGVSLHDVYIHIPDSHLAVDSACNCEILRRWKSTAKRLPLNVLECSKSSASLPILRFSSSPTSESQGSI